MINHLGIPETTLLEWAGLALVWLGLLLAIWAIERYRQS